MPLAFPPPEHAPRDRRLQDAGVELVERCSRRLVDIVDIVGAPPDFNVGRFVLARRRLDQRLRQDRRRSAA